MNLSWKLLSLVFCLGASLEAAVLLSPRCVTVKGRSETLVDVVFINDSGTSQPCAPAEQLKALLYSGTARTEELVLQREGPAEAGSLVPGAFRRVSYRLDLPARVNGPVVLEVAGLECEPVMFSVQPKDIVFFAGDSPAKPAAAVQADAQAASASVSATGPAGDLTEEKRETALRRSTRILPGLEAYEPVYFGLGASGGLNAKFQLSLKYNPFDRLPLYAAYTQTSLWDLHSESKPFDDTSYKPALFYEKNLKRTSADGRIRYGWRGGFEHESNGKGGDDSRSINIAFFRPKLEYRFGEDNYFVVAPKIYGYLDKEENPDIDHYRGYVDLYLGYIYSDFRLSCVLRKGTEEHYGSIQVDAVMPLRWTDSFFEKAGVTGVNGYFFVQYFNGWGEAILHYNEKMPSQFRAGVMVVP